MKTDYHMNRLALRACMYAIVLTCLNACALLYRDLAPPTVSIAGIGLAGIDNQLNLRLRTRLLLDNPNSAALPVRGGRAQLTINGIDIGAALIEDSFKIPAGGSTEIELPVQLSLGQAMSAGIAALNEGRPEITYRVAGHIDLGVSYLGRMPFDETGELRLTGN